MAFYLSLSLEFKNHTSFDWKWREKWNQGSAKILKQKKRFREPKSLGTSGLLDWVFTGKSNPII
jgi:hypothetical protein